MDRTVDRVIPVFLFLFILLVLRNVPGHPWDNMCWVNWATHINKFGLENAYASGTDYLPAYHYILWLYGKMEGNANDIAANIPYLRVFTLIFDFLGLWYVYKWTDKRTPYLTILLFCILNIAYSYNTLFWGQVDGIFSALIFISLYYAWRDKMLWSAVLLILACNFKLQAVFILPVWGLLFLNNFIARPNWKKIVVPIAGAFVVQVLILIPFVLGCCGLKEIGNVITNSVDKFPLVAMGASNMWCFVVQNANAQHDYDIFIAGFTYKKIGLFLFLLTAFIALLPMMLLVIKQLTKTKQQVAVSREIIFLTAALVFIVFFYFNTQMHERYAHPAFIFIVAYAFLTRDFMPCILFSIAYFLNLERVLVYLHLNVKTLIFDERLISALYAICIVYMLVRLYKTFFLEQKNRIVKEQ